MYQGCEMTAATSTPHGSAVRPSTCRMFETPLIERFSRSHPLLPFVFWLPAIAYLGVRAAQNDIGPLAGLGLVFAGLFVWTFAEYILHRYLFHYVGPRPWQRRVHFILHGVHHDFPQDTDRLVFPLGASIPMGAGFYLLFRALVGPVLVDPVFMGFGLGYLAYDGTHYAVHHWRMTSRWGKWIKRHHMVHHHTGEEARWGVSSPLWDYVFGTMGSPKADKTG
ncbi:Fatty acid hydroxylase [Chondromyces apiculatus DSM 436]|uniref:Fatty acid hydroxylase n=2 Tax=Chondromyces apiculatus TaxID=51 RepID=A0A017SU15_9BACT|nr:Fatty acid hydroxylase [Chondromyces apiculatus DSM 436]